MKIMILALLAAMAGWAWGGSADALLRGETSSGRTKLELRVGDLDGLIREVKLTVDGEEITWKNADHSPQTVIRDVENGVYVLSVTQGEKSFRLWMVPGSEKVVKKGPNEFESRFAAIIEASDPRAKTPLKWTPRITIGCHLKWKI
ncbi:MAG: hypothetical protein ACQKBY_04345 [Verrucomicrobiales bacterium]